MPLSKQELKKGLRASLADGTASSVNGTLTGTYTVPFALALGANAGEVGILSAVPKLAGTLVQPFVWNLIKHLHGCKRTAIIMSLVARLFWIPVILLPFIFGSVISNGFSAIVLLIAFVSLSQFASSAAVTTWASWIGNIVPEKIRGRFFGTRGALAGMAGLLATLGGGALLGLMAWPVSYALLFGIAVFFGLVATAFMARVPAPAVHDRGSESLLREFGTEFRSNRQFARFTMFMALTSLSVYIASPFFTVSILQDFRINLFMFAIISAASTVATILTQPYWGRFSDRFGDRTAIAVCSILIALVPGMWLFVQNPVHMILVYIISGFAWAGFDLATFNYLLDVTPAKKRSAYISNHTMIVGLTTFIGPLLGGIIAELNRTHVMAGQSTLGIVFALSFIMRFMIAAIFVPQLRELRASRVPHADTIFWKAITIYPLRFFAHEIAAAPHWIHLHPRIQLKPHMKGLLSFVHVKDHRLKPVAC